MDNETAQQNQFAGWALLEIFGHQRYVGFVKTINLGTSVMFQVDVPELPAREVILRHPEYVESTWTPAGSTVQKEAVLGYSKFFGVGAIYAMTPCDEATAMATLEQLSSRGTKLVRLANQEQLTSGNEDKLYLDEDPGDE